MKETFGQYIRQLRNSKGYNLTKLAAMLDIDSGALSKIETNKKILDDKLLPKLAKIFNLDLQNLKDEYYSEKIAKVLYEKHYSSGLLAMALPMPRLAPVIKIVLLENCIKPFINLE